MVEILAVIAILAILGGLGFGTYMLVNRNARITQAEVMIENLTSKLEERSRASFTEDQLANLSGVLESGTMLPSGDGLDGSSVNLYAFLSGDYNLNGSFDDGEGTPMIPELDPNYDGQGKYVNDSYELIDPWGTPLRYKFTEDGLGLNNNVEGGFDIWSAGPDLEFEGTNSDGEDATLDNITNW